MNNFKLSIITICLNSEKTIEKTLKSIINQSFQNFEYIVIDGDSKDKTMHIINRYKYFFKDRIKIISEPDTGIYNAMNKGINLASGNWIHVLNSDDQYTHHTILEDIFEKNNDISKYDWILNDISLKNKRFVPMSYQGFIIIPHPGMIIKKTFYLKKGLYSEKYKIISDSVYINKNYYEAKIIILKHVLVNMADTGISNRFSFKLLQEFFLLVFKYSKSPLYIKIILFIDSFTKYNLKKIIKNKLQIMRNPNE